MNAAAASLSSVRDTLGRGLRWWGEGLGLALPSWAMALALGDRRCVHLEADEEGILSARLTSKPFGEGAIAEASLDGARPYSSALKTIRSAAKSRPVVFTPPPDRVLTQTVMVPEAALENLDQAVSFGVSTWTPFDADMLVYHPDVVERRGEQARIRIRMIPRKVLEPWLEAARDAGTPVRLVAFDRDLKACAEIGEPSKRAAMGNRLDLALFSCALVLGAALLGTLHYQWASELDRLDAGIRAEVAQQAKQRAVEQKLAQLEERRRLVLTKRAREPRLAEIVAAIANALPETAEVSEFGWSGAQGRLVVVKAAAQEVRAALDGAAAVTAGPPQTVGGDRSAFELAFRKPMP